MSPITYGLSWYITHEILSSLPFKLQIMTLILRWGSKNACHCSFLKGVNIPIFVGCISWMWNTNRKWHLHFHAQIFVFCTNLFVNFFLNNTNILLHPLFFWKFPSQEKQKTRSNSSQHMSYAHVRWMKLASCLQVS